ncbi:MAG: N-acetyltransferase [Kiritimatiellales bacterium]|nr:N-acetyltransferase [Kiritimatiellales bacterium]
MKLEKYNPQDQDEISELFTKTFSDSEGHEEGKLIGQLTMDLLINTNANDLYCFVAKEDKKIVGSIIFTRMTFETEINAFILGPVAIHTNFQGKGIGQNLIKFGLHSLSKDGVELAITYGDPKFYSKVGFSVISEKIIPAPLELSQPEGWLAQSLTSDEVESIAGVSRCVQALNKPEYW